MFLVSMLIKLVVPKRDKYQSCNFFYLLSLFYLGLGWSVTSHVTVTVTRSYDTEKVLEQMILYNIVKAY